MTPGLKWESKAKSLFLNILQISPLRSRGGGGGVDKVPQVRARSLGANLGEG